MALVVRINDKAAQVALDRTEHALRPRSVLRIANEVMQGSIDETFRQEGHPAGSWRRLNASSLERAFEGGGSQRRARRKDGRNTKGFLRFARGKKILTDSGRLRRSIVGKIAGSKLEIGTSLVYAAIHQRGGMIRAKGSGVLRIPLGGGAVIYRKSVVIPSRPYLLIKPGDPPAIAEAVEGAAAAGFNDRGGVSS